MTINGQTAYQQFLQNGYWPDEATRQAGLQWAGANITPSNPIELSNPYAQVWNGAAQQYMPRPAASAYGQGPNANPDIVFGGTPTGTKMPVNPTTGNVGGTAPVAGTATAQGVGGGYTPPAPAAGSATATNPFLALGLNAYTNTQGVYDTQWLDRVRDSLFQQGTQNLQDNVFPGMNQAAIAAGGYGGDRSQIAKGVAADRMNQSVFNAMAPAYAQGYEAWQNRALQAGQAAAGTGLGLEGLDLNRLLGIGDLQNKGRALDISQQQADTQTAGQAAASAGVPTYTNPWAAGVGGALTMAQILNLLFGGK